MFLSKLVIATIVTGLKSMLLEFLRCFQEPSFVRVTNGVVSANKTTQVGTSFGEADLPYEQGGRILVPRSSKGGFPLQSHSDTSHSKDMRVIKGSSVTIANDKRRVKPY